MVDLLVMIQEFYCTNTREYTTIPSCRGKLVFDSSRLQEGIFVYTLVKWHNKANILNECVCKNVLVRYFDFDMFRDFRTWLE